MNKEYAWQNDKGATKKFCAAVVPTTARFHKNAYLVWMYYQSTTMVAVTSSFCLDETNKIC